MYGASLCWRSFGVSGTMCCNPGMWRKTEDREQTNWPSTAPSSWRSHTGDTVSLLTQLNRPFSYTFILEEKMKYVSESMMVPNAVVFLSCLVDVSLCSQKAKREKAAMHHRQLHLLVSCVLVLRNVNVLLYSLFVCLFNYVGLVFFHSIWV